MILLIAFGLIGLLAPGWLMACCGMGSRTEEEPCLVGFFRFFGGLLIAIAVWMFISNAMSHAR